MWIRGTKYIIRSSSYFFNKLPIVWYWGGASRYWQLLIRTRGRGGEGVKVQIDKIGRSRRLDFLFGGCLLSVGPIIENPSQWLGLKLPVGEYASKCEILLHPVHDLVEICPKTLWTRLYCILTDKKCQMTTKGVLKWKSWKTSFKMKFPNEIQPRRVI